MIFRELCCGGWELGVIFRGAFPKLRSPRELLGRWEESSHLPSPSLRRRGEV